MQQNPRLGVRRLVGDRAAALTPGCVSLWSQIENGYFVHYFAPDSLSTMPKNVIFVIDKSGSMMGRKIKQVGPVGQVGVLKARRHLTPSALVQQANQTCPPSSK